MLSTSLPRSHSTFSQKSRQEGTGSDFLEFDQKREGRERKTTSPYYRNELIIEIANITIKKKEMQAFKEISYADMVNFLAVSKHYGML